MDKSRIKEIYLRTDKNDLRGTNIKAVDKFIKMIKNLEKSNDTNVQDIGTHFENIGELAPNFTIFEGKDSFFMHKFKAYQLSEESDIYTDIHEFGHAILSITTDTKVPDNYEQIIKNAKNHALNEENKRFFKDYIEYLSGKTEKRDERSEVEKGPLSDIISSIFQQQGFRINTKENICILPSSHTRDYYYDVDNDKINVKKVFDEDFANFFVLKSKNCSKELKIFERLFGSELVNILNQQLQVCSEVIRNPKKKDSILRSKEESAMEQLVKNALNQGMTTKDINEAKNIEKSNEKYIGSNKKDEECL